METIRKAGKNVSIRVEITERQERGMYSLDEVRNVDPEIAQAIVDEQNRQNSHIELIASENWVSRAVMAAMGSPLTNKYAEGYPGKRYYGGCECVDVVEDLARDRAKELHREGKGTVRLRLCQCTAPFRRTGKYGGIFCGDGAGRYLYGHESGSWRTSVPWVAG